MALRSCFSYSELTYPIVTCPKSSAHPPTAMCSLSDTYLQPLPDYLELRIFTRFVGLYSNPPANIIESDAHAASAMMTHLRVPGRFSPDVLVETALSVGYLKGIGSLARICERIRYSFSSSSSCVRTQPEIG